MVLVGECKWRMEIGVVESPDPGAKGYSAMFLSLPVYQYTPSEEFNR